MARRQETASGLFACVGEMNGWCGEARLRGRRVRGRGARSCLGWKAAQGRNACVEEKRAGGSIV